MLEFCLKIKYKNLDTNVTHKDVIYYDQLENLKNDLEYFKSTSKVIEYSTYVLDEIDINTGELLRK